MNRRELVLAALSTAKGATFTPVQVQKLFFLIDQNVAAGVGGPHFSFEPYHYGPFDSMVYSEIERLSAEGAAVITSAGSLRGYGLTPEGQVRGEEFLRHLDDPTRGYIEQASAAVRRLSFPQLVSAIYRAYPEMRARSVFQE